MNGIAPGILLLYLLDAVILTVPVSVVLIWLYQRSVEREMRAVAPGAPLSEFERLVAERRVDVDAAKGERSARLRLSAVYTLAGVAAAAVWTAV
jgi:hypothetical protein